MTVPAKALGQFLETLIDDEIILMNVTTGDFHSLKGVSVEIWNRIDGTNSVESIADKLASLYAIEPQACLRDVSSFLADLSKAGMVVTP